MKVIAIDIGTSSMKSLLYREDGKLEKTFQQEYYSTYPQEGYVEQDPESWKEALIYVLGEMGKYLKEVDTKAEALVVTSQRSSLIPMDKDGNPLRYAIMWQDKRSLPQCNRLIKKYTMEALYKKTGLRTNPYFVLPKILWLKENEPEIFAKTEKFIGVQDYVVHLMTGKYVTDHSQACRTLLMDIEKFEWDKKLLDIAGISEESLPDLVNPGTVSGNLVGEMKDLLGSESDLPVIISGGDQQNAAVALGVIKEGRAEANTGTGSFIISATDKPFFDDDCRVLCQASAIPGKWIVEAGIFNTGAIYRWFRNQFYNDVDADKAYSIMEKEAIYSDIGAGGITMIPHFHGSAAPYWNPRAKGLFFNLSLDSKRGDFTRALLEGISSELAINVRLIEKSTHDIHLVSVAGGMTKSDLFCEIQSNFFGKKVIKFSNAEASSLGAAMIAFVNLGVYENIEEAYENMSEKSYKAYKPDVNLKDIYTNLYNRKMVLYDAINFGEVYDAFD